MGNCEKCCFYTHPDGYPDPEYKECEYITSNSLPCEDIDCDECLYSYYYQGDRLGCELDKCKPLYSWCV